jgi:hypothetical protein
VHRDYLYQFSGLPSQQRTLATFSVKFSRDGDPTENIGDTVRTLRNIASLIELRGVPPARAAIVDINGNTIGSFGFEPK